MKQLILSFSDSNMAGYVWQWQFFLGRTLDGTYELTSEQIVNEDEPREIDPKIGLRDGADVYEALQETLAEIGLSPDDFDLSATADKIANLDRAMADQFRFGPELLGERHAVEETIAAQDRDSILQPYREIIDRYVLKISDAPLRYPGGGSYGNPRGWIKRFIEDYVVANGHLPTGEHQIVVQNGGSHYSGGTRDFSDLK